MMIGSETAAAGCIAAWPGIYHVFTCAPGPNTRKRSSGEILTTYWFHGGLSCSPRPTHYTQHLIWGRPCRKFQNRNGRTKKYLNSMFVIWLAYVKWWFFSRPPTKCISSFLSYQFRSELLAFFHSTICHNTTIVNHPGLLCN